MGLNSHKGRKICIAEIFTGHIIMLELKCNLKTEPYANGYTRVHNLDEGEE